MLKRFPQTTSRRFDARLSLSVGAVVASMAFALLLGKIAGEGEWLYLALAAVAVPVIVWPIEFALGLYAFLIPFDSVTTLGAGTTGTTANLLVGAMCGAAILGTGLMRNRLRWPARAAWMWLVFLGWSAITATWALRTDFALHELATPISLVLLYLAAVSWPITDKQLRWLSRVTIAGGCVASWMVIYLFSSGVSYLAWTSRASLAVAGRETNPDRFAAELLLPLALATAELLSDRNWRGKILAGVASASICYTILITMSRASLVAIAAMLVVFAIRTGVNRRMLLAGSVFVCLVGLMPATFFARIQNMISSGGDGRLDIWKAGLSVWRRYWLFGAGFANFPIAYQDFAGVAPVFHGYNRGSHNTYLQTAAELGIIGTLLLAYTLYAHFHEFSRFRLAEGKFPKSKLSFLVVGLEAASWAMVAYGLFADLLWEKGFWLVLTFSIMATRSRKEFAGTRTREIVCPEDARRYSGQLINSSVAKD
jgi:hypothetical protein